MLDDLVKVCGTEEITVLFSDSEHSDLVLSMYTCKTE